MSKTKEVIGRTGRFTQEERATYLMDYKFDLGDRYLYVDEEGILTGVGYSFVVSKDGKFKSGSHFTPFDRASIDKRVSENNFQKDKYKFVIEYEADYE